MIKEVKKSISIANRGLNYGDAVFETLRISGGKIYFWEAHYFRLMSSMRILRMEIPMNFTMEFLEEELFKAIENTPSESRAYRAKILVWRQEGGKFTPATRDVDYVITVEALEKSFYILDENDYEVELYRDHYVLADLLSTLKTNNRLVNILGGIFAEENDYQNCLLLNDKKQVVEALNANIFLVKDKHIKTPPIADGCINGVMRRQLLIIIKTLPDYTVEEASISPFELQKADEMFITNVITGIIPVTKYRKKKYVNDTAKLLVTKLNVHARMS